MGKIKKALLIIMLPLCFVWFCYTGYLFWDDLTAWRLMVPGYSFLDATGLLLIRNIPSFIAIFIAYWWIEHS